MAINKKNAAENKETIVIEPIKLVKTEVVLIGETPLLVHAWSEKSKRMMLESQQKLNKAKKAKPVRDPFSEFMHAAYWITEMPKEDTPEAFEEAVADGAKFGFKTIAIKEATLAAAYRAGYIPNQVGMRCNFYLNSTDYYNGDPGMELAAIETPEPPFLREDPVKIGGASKTADLRYRPEFRNWRIRVKITLIDTGVFSMSSIVNALNLAGQMNGIGEWRMERGGDFGRFHVATDEELRELKIS